MPFQSYDFLAPDGTTFSNKGKAAAYALQHYTREDEELVKNFNSPSMTAIKSEPKTIKCEPKTMLPLGLNDLPGLNVKMIQSNVDSQQRHRFNQTIKGAQLEALTSVYKKESYPNQV